MKVCFVITSFSYFLSHRYELLKELALKHDVVLATDLSEISPAHIQAMKYQQIELMHLSQRRKLSVIEYVKYLNRLYKVIKKIRPDSIFLITLELTLFGGILSRLDKSRCKWNFVISGLGSFYDAQKLRYKIFKAILFLNIRFILNKSKSTFIFQNPDNQQLFIQNNLINKENSRIIFGNGISLLKKNLADLSFVQPRFCFVGRLAKSKGIVEFISASKMINQSYPNIEFLVAGNFEAGSEDYCSMEFYNSIKKLTHIKFIGYLEHKKVYEIYKKGDVFVLPSYGEGLPKAALEAASLSLPLILTDVPGCKECIEENGLLVQSQNSQALKQAMEEFINNPQLINTMGKKSLEICSKKFSIEKIAGDYDKLILR